jgi:DNA-binding MurR/RpiR family transcriptional regulator
MDEAVGMTVRERTRRLIGELTAAERRVARALLAAYPIAGLESVSRLAERAKVSAPTVTRFVTKLRFDGYRQFQEALREEIQARASSPLARYREQGAPPDQDLLGAVFGDLHRLLDDTTAIAPAEFDAIVSLLADRRRRVGCTGGRISQAASFYLFTRLHQLRPHVCHLGLGPLPREDELIDLGRRDVLIVFDVRRYQDDTVRLAQQAAERGICVVLVTDRWLSPAADVATHVLPFPVETVSPFDSIMPGIALIEALVAALVARGGQRAQGRIEELEAVRRRAPVERATAATNGATR